MSDILKNMDKDKIFESLIKELSPLTTKSQRKDFKVAKTKSGKIRRLIWFDYQGHEVQVELKDKE